jgi:hypothetical protein
MLVQLREGVVTLQILCMSSIAYIKVKPQHNKVLKSSVFWDIMP